MRKDRKKGKKEDKISWKGKEGRKKMEKSDEKHKKKRNT